MRTNIVMVDWESVQPESFDLLAPVYFRVLVFVGATQNKLPFEVVDRIHRLGERAEFVKISGVGRNALDFHIAYYIGKLAAADPDVFFHIISRDNGFGPLVEHLKEHDIFSARWPDIESIPAVKAAQAKSPQERATLVFAKLQGLLVPKPRSEKGLRSAVDALFNKQLSDGEVTAVLERLQADRTVVIVNGRVNFPTLDHPAAT
ncbi:PIN domain-containing protein [Ramlibacter sp. AN1015]|uniref:PIN domain-containing protein n=1 Tax=Ramlibacter sp. AN1015 TaxID=3133428 RepID=UPI0030BF5E1D